MLAESETESAPTEISLQELARRQGLGAAVQSGISLEELATRQGVEATVQMAISLEELANRQGIDVAVQLAELVQQIEGEQTLWRLRGLAIYSLLGIFVVGNLATISLFFLNGLKVAELSDVAMGSLAAATIAEVAGLLTIVVKGLFPE